MVINNSQEKSIENNKNRINYLTFISVISAISVLMLHTNGCFWNFSKTEFYWKSANVIESVFYFSVPLFFMISGITLMDFYDRNSLQVYFMKRIKKAVVPFLTWSLFAVILELCKRNISISDISAKYLYQSITGNTLIGMYWFFIPLFIIYLCMPLFSAVEKSKRKQVFSYLVIGGFVLNILVPFLKNILVSDLNAPYNMPVISGALIWPLLGWLLHHCEIKRWQKGIIYLLALVGLLMHVCGTYVLSMSAGEIVQTYKGYENVPCVLYSVGMFIFLRDMGMHIMEKPKYEKIINWLGKYTFSIYLMQFLLLSIFPHIPFVNINSLLYRLIAPFVMIPIIIVITWCMRKVPVIKYMVP